MSNFKRPAGRTARVKPPFAAEVADDAGLPPVETGSATAPLAVAMLADAAEATGQADAPTTSIDLLPAPAAVPFNAIHEGTDMATTAADATAQTTDKVQTLISDAQARARETMDKGARSFEEIGSFAKGNVEALMASSRVAASGMEALGQEMADYGKRSIEQATSAFKSFATVKSPTELFQLQSDYARSAFDGLVAEGSRMSERMLKLAGDVAQPLSSRMAVAAETMKVGL